MALIPGFSINGNALHVTRSYSEDDADAFARAKDDAGSREFSGGCLDGRVFDLRGRTTDQPSILIVPQLTRNGVAYNQLPNTRTNFIQNSAMLGATGSVLPTTWSIVAPPSGITVTYSSAGVTTASDGTSVDYIDVTVSGTALASGNFNLRPEPVSSTVSGNLLFAAGITYTASFYMALLSGSVSGISPNYQIQEVSGTTFVVGTSLDLSAITSSLTRYSVTRQMVGTGGADRVRTRYGHAIASGQVLDYTIRIASPQLEKGSVATRLIRTATQFLTAALENGLTVLRAGAPPDFTVIRNTTATRVNSSGLIESVASGLLRLDYPVTGGCPAALIEPAGTNLVLQSRDLSVSGSWTVSGVTAVKNAVGADGIASGATTLTATAASGTITQALSHASQSRIFSAFIRRVSGSGAIELTTNGGTNWDAVTLTTGYTQLACTARTVASGTVGIRMIASGDVIEVDYTQGEVGPVATSPIPTTTASATRNADVCSVTGVSGYIGQTEGTIYFEVDAANASSQFFRINSGVSNAIHIYKNASDRYQVRIYASGNSIDFTDTSAKSGFVKIAFAYKSGESALVINGGSPITSATAYSFSAALGTINFLGGVEPVLPVRIRAAAIYTTRLTNDQLANLTRLT